MARSYRVGIAGFGVAGATTAFLLARDGHAVTVMEQAADVGPIGAGVLLQASGQTVLRHLGLLESVVAHAAPIEMLDAQHLDRSQLIRTVYSELEPECRAYGVHRGVLFRALENAVNTQPVELRLHSEITTREVKPDGVYLTDHTGRRHGPFDFIVCGDGSRSRLRKACGFRARVMAYDHGTLWVTVPGTAVQGRLLQIVRRNQRMCGLLPLGDGLCSLYWGLPLREFPEVRANGLDPLKREILSYAPEAVEMLDLVVDFEQLLLTSYRHVWMRRCHDRHTLFLGDAAHAMSPHLGQGINLAMVDAYRFADCLRTAPNPPAAFRQFVQSQRAYLRYYSAITFLLSPFFQSDWRILGWGRDLALPLLPRIPWVKRQMLLTVSGLKSGFLGGRIRI